MGLKLDISELATLKIKIDLLKDKYKNDTDAIKKKLKESGETSIDDPSDYLSLNLVPNGKRTFSVSGVKEAFPENVDTVIQETVNTKAFDVIAKDKAGYVITEDIQKQCFSVGNEKSLHWIGLDVHKQKLKEKFRKS